jgi:hypothetical protein
VRARARREGNRADAALDLRASDHERRRPTARQCTPDAPPRLLDARTGRQDLAERRGGALHKFLLWQVTPFGVKPHWRPVCYPAALTPAEILQPQVDAAFLNAGD